MAAEENPWRVPLLDLRPIALGMLSTSQDPRSAENLVSLTRDDGTSFIGQVPSVAREVPAGLRYRVEGALADGVLFAPREMEHKWAIYAHGGQLLFIRSWSRQLHAVADVRMDGGELEVTSVRGAFVDESEPPAFTVRLLDFLLRSHALGEVVPAPLPPGIEQDAQRAALWCFTAFGNRALFATPHPVTLDAPQSPLRTDSLLHIAIARGDVDAATAQLDAGVPAELRARDGLAPLHWALARDEDTRMATLLLERGSSPDVRSDEGATPLMNAVQGGRMTMAVFLLDRGADPSAADHRGYTSLHRAAEMGKPEFVRLLLDRGASPGPEAQGHTPRSLAESRNHADIVAMLDGR